MRRAALTFVILLVIAMPARADLRAGAAAVDVTPTDLPVFVNGGMLSRIAKEVKAKLYARAIVVADGDKKLAIVVVDSCMVPRKLLDTAKALASTTTGIPVSNMLIGATHTHSAPSTFGALGTPTDPKYEAFLVPKLAEAIKQADANLEPARVGAAVIDAGDFTAVRRWILRPDKMQVDPFGNRTMRAHMHTARNLDDVTGPSGPEDPDLSIVSFQSRDGRPIALLANFANHYVGASPLSPDYFGMFAERVQLALQPPNDETNHPPFVAMMSQGTSGDVWLRDYFDTKWKRPNISEYTDGVVKLALQAYKTIEYDTKGPIGVEQTELELKYRVPDAQMLAWAKGIVEAMGDRPPKTTTEVYAREQLYLHEMQKTKLIVQAMRIGDIALTALPNEVYAITGLKLKALSPFKTTVNIELANGAEGYIPPPEQHHLGGYNTWPARSAGLQIDAEPIMVEALVRGLERLAGEPRAWQHSLAVGAGITMIEAMKPIAYWRMQEWSAKQPLRGKRFARQTVRYEPGVVFSLEGPLHEAFALVGMNRSAHFCGGRLRGSVKLLDAPLSTRLKSPESTYSVSLWFWNGLVTDARPVTGYIFSRGRDQALGAPGDHLGLGGTAGDDMQGRLFFFNGNDANQIIAAKTPIKRWTWTHVVLTRDGERVQIYVNGKLDAEGRADVTIPFDVTDVFIGGRNDNYANFEGRIDEVAIFDRVLTAKEVAKLASPGGED